ncbi:MAG: hypothetical protein ACYTGH_22105, partial [Planctomycetota bacterium]
MGEGISQLAVLGHLFDQSVPMQKAYRAFVARKYGTDEALRAAWGDDHVTLQSVTVPTDQAYSQSFTTDPDHPAMGQPPGREVPHRLHWPDPKTIRREQDYCLCMREALMNFITTLARAAKRVSPESLVGIDAFKQTMVGWRLAGRWCGDYKARRGLMHPVTGAIGVAEMLDMEEIDVVATPHDYIDRNMGMGYEPEGIGDSVVLRGKLMLVEEDQRTDVLNDPAPFDALTGQAEYEAGFWRNQGASISRGYQTYLCEMSGLGSWFEDDAIMEIMAARGRVQDAALRWEREEVASIAMIIDDWSLLSEELVADYEDLAVIRQRLLGLSRCGVPFRIYLFDDLYRDDFPSCHRTFLFPNLFEVDEKKMAVLREKVFTGGRMAIFGPASGISNGSELSAESATALTGIPLKMLPREMPRRVTIDRFTHPVTAPLEELHFGDSFAYGPLLVPQAEEGITRLGGIQW